MRNRLASVGITLVLLGVLPLAQGAATLPAQVQPQTPPPLTLLTAQGRRPFPTRMVSGQEMVAIDDLVSLLQVAAREEAAAGGITLSYKGRTVVVSQDQAMASVGGRIVPLPSPALRVARRWMVPLDLVPRGIGPIYDGKIELRRPSRLLIVGDLRVPRVTVRLDSVGPPTRLSIEASPSTLISSTLESGRVVLRLDADALDVAPLPQAGGFLDQAHVEGNTVVLTLSPRAGQARASQAAGDNLSRINVEVPAAQQTGAADPAAPPSTPPTPSTTAPNATPPSPNGSTPAPATAQGVRLVVLDPGHGGAEVGVTGRSGVQEKTLTLDIARRVKTLLETRLGIRVLLTRDDDKDVTLDERATLANTNKADLFVSLHLNASLAPMANGAEVYQLKLPREAAARGATDEPLTLPVATGGTRTVSLVPWDLAQARHRDDSTLLANLLESALRARVPMGTRPIQESPMRVLAGLDMASVLVELAYLSNPEQEAAVQSEDFQTRVAEAILETVTAYRAAWRGDR